MFCLIANTLLAPPFSPHFAFVNNWFSLLHVSYIWKRLGRKHDLPGSSGYPAPFLSSTTTRAMSQKRQATNRKQKRNAHTTKRRGRKTRKAKRNAQTSKTCNRPGTTLLLYPASSPAQGEVTRPCQERARRWASTARDRITAQDLHISTQLHSRARVASLLAFSL